MSHITFVDLDETLVRSFARISVIKDGKVLEKLTNMEFNEHELGEGEEYDFSEFVSSEVFKGSIPLIENIKEIFDRHGANEIAILTARGDFDDKNAFLKTLRDFGIPAGHYENGEIHVIRCATPGIKPCDAKILKIKKILSKRPDVTGITLIDDSVSNLKAVMNADLGVTKDLEIVTESGIQRIIKESK